MEAAALFERFENNLETIFRYIKKGLDVRTTPYEISMPLEVNLLCDVLNQKGFNYKVDKAGFDALVQFHDFYVHDKERILDTFHQILEDKRAYIKTADGTVLLKEQLIRRLEYFNEIAHSMEVIARLQQLGSPLQYNYPFLNN
ncbi:hypothetical protein [Rufibacter roseus]|uniref:Uncharacterized protein n=1 Tax=Rufibacter roseus TaxID=1567108 RepID=A0ABW2DKE7_9BACT|nr:hypothetical protein [Rufibacter roseus]